MPSAFDFEHSPFDCLTAEERERVRAHVDIAYFREGEAILEAGMAPTHLFVVIKGFVQQFEHGGSEAVASFGPHDTFDGRSLLSGQVGGRFVAAEEVLAYQLARQVVTELIARNATFGALLFSDLSNKLAAIAGRVGQHELQSLALARVDAIPVRAPHFVDADCDVLSVVRLLQA
jgi:CBS domain-containing protein